MRYLLPLFIVVHYMSALYTFIFIVLASFSLTLAVFSLLRRGANVSPVITGGYRIRVFRDSAMISDRIRRPALLPRLISWISPLFSSRI